MSGTTEDDIIEDDDKLTIALECSVYYTKPLHTLVTITENITWIKR